MLNLDDKKWQELEGGYRVPYDASVALRALREGEDVWSELWDELHHQGDVGSASYAAVPQLVDIAALAAERDWNFYGLIATIKVESHRKGNPPIPAWLRPAYDEAWTRALQLGLTDLVSSTDTETTRAILSVLALAKGDLRLGVMLNGADSSEIDEWLDDNVNFSELYE